MDIIEWVMVVAILDGPTVGLLYIIWRKFKQ